MSNTRHRTRIDRTPWLVMAVVLLQLPPALAAAFNEPILPLPETLSVNPAQASLGRSLFYDVRLSGNKKLSCASCHDLARGGADNKALSLGFKGVPTAVNAPTVFNSAFNFKQFWNGRAESLEAQIHEVVENPVEMGSTWTNAVAMASHDTSYREGFARAYPNGVSAANIENAIANFERTLITPNSRFDKYLRGDTQAITAEEKVGYAKFKQYGCVACHQGKNIGGNMYQKFGVMADYFARRGHLTRADLGRYLVTGREEDRYVFKVPSLRNVALTAPYFHDGTATTLNAAVDVMVSFQVGRVASSADKAAIVAFLKTLTGERKSGL